MSEIRQHRARYRHFPIALWNRPCFKDVLATPASLAVLFHLWTGPQSSPFGYYKASLEALAADLGCPPEIYKLQMNRLAVAGLLMYDEQAQVVFLTEFLPGGNAPPNANVLKGWRRWFDELPRATFARDFVKQLHSVCANGRPDLRRAFDEEWADLLGKKRLRERAFESPSERASRIQYTVDSKQRTVNRESRGHRAGAHAPSHARGREASNVHHLPDAEWLAALPARYPGIDVNAELRRMDEWLHKHPGRRKTRRFIEAWLDRCDSGASVVPPAKPVSGGGNVGEFTPEERERQRIASEQELESTNKIR